MTDTIDWNGKSGTAYRYWFLARMTADGILAVGGNYCFAMRLANGNFTPLYFGESENLQTRLPSHDRWDEAKRLGATHVWAHSTPAGASARAAEEQDLIQYWNPPLNVQHRKVS
jgi:hypothetical protein